VPIRGLETSKTRLGEALDAEERQELVVDLLRRTLAATRDASRIAGTVVVTRDPDAAGIATDLRAIGLVERAPGLNEAIVAARSLAVARGASAVVVIPADLPGITSDAIDELVDRASRIAEVPDADRRGVVALIPDRHDRGTNALFIAPPDLIDPAFGEASRDRHRTAATAAGAAYLELDGPLTLDLDTAADLLAAEASLGSRRG
jgi:2-phospho-L-lactate guanylyltransferase